MLHSIHQFRGLAIAWVVLAHAKFLVAWPESPTLSSRLQQAVIEGGDIPFVFLAGFLFQHTSLNFRYGPYLWARARSVLAPYLVCSVPALAHAYVFRYGLFEARESLFEPSMLPAIAHSLWTAQHMFVPFWFIPTIAVLFALAPLWLLIDQRPGLYDLLPPMLVTASMLHLSPLYLDVVRDALNVLPVYLLGMAVSRRREGALASLRRARHALLAGALSMLAADAAFGSGARIASAAPFSTEHGLLDLAYLQKVAVTLWAFQALAARESLARARAARIDRLLARLGDLSFGIFFAHMYLLNHLVKPAWLRFAALPEAGWFPLIGFTAAYLGVSVLLVLLAKRIAGPRSRYLIGC